MSVTRVYGAEREVFGARMGTADTGMALENARALVHQHLPGWTVRRSSTYGSTCWVVGRTIDLGRYAGLPVVLHEIAHGLADTTGHDAAFLRAYLALVEQHMGVYWRRRLAAGLRRRKVRGAAAACRSAPGGTLEP